MGRWTQYDEDEYRLPSGVRRTGYDADTGEYFFSGGYKSIPYSEYGPLVPVGTLTKQTTSTISEDSSPRSELASTLRLKLATTVHDLWERYKYRERRDPVVSPTEEGELSPQEDEPPKDREMAVTLPITLLSKRDKPAGELEDSNSIISQFTLPIHDKFSTRSKSLSAISSTGSNVSSSSSFQHTRSATTPEVSRVDGNRDRAEETSQDRKIPRPAKLPKSSENPFSRPESSSSANATIGSGSRTPSCITESDHPGPPLPPKDCYSRATSLSSSDIRESWSTEGGSLSSLPYLGVSSKFQS